MTWRRTSVFSIGTAWNRASLPGRASTMLRTRGEVAERLKAAVLKTVDRRRSGGSNPPLSANNLLKTIIYKTYHNSTTKLRSSNDAAWRFPRPS